MQEHLENVRIIFDGWTRFVLATQRTADGAAMERAILDHGTSVAVLPYDAKARTALLVTQTRAPLIYLGENAPLLEAIAGRVEKEDPAAAARREALEEAGLRLGELEPVATCWPSPGVSTERIALYLSAYSAADRIARDGGAAAEHEVLSIKEMPLRILTELAANGMLPDMKTLLLVQALQLHHRDLFD